MTLEEGMSKTYAWIEEQVKQSEEPTYYEDSFGLVAGTV